MHFVLLQMKTAAMQAFENLSNLELFTFCKIGNTENLPYNVHHCLLVGSLCSTLLQLRLQFPEKIDAQPQG
jgi:hypothetical protein